MTRTRKIAGYAVLAALGFLALIGLLVVIPGGFLSAKPRTPTLYKKLKGWLDRRRQAKAAQQQMLSALADDTDSPDQPQAQAELDEEARFLASLGTGY